VVKAPPTRPADTALATSTALRAALAAATSADDCAALHPDDSMFADEGPQQITVQRLSADKLLVSQNCWRAAYNTGDGYWVVNDRAPYHPTLVTASAADGDVRSIEQAHKGRGLGDCWYTASWVWNGTRFVKSAEANSGLCRLVAAGGAWQMPTLVSEVKDAP